MAQRTVVLMTDDLDGSKAEETIRFGFAGTSYEIDLNKKNAKQLRETVSRYVLHARKTGGGAGRSRTRARASGSPDSSQSAVDPKAVRAWAEQQGIAVSSRGRIPGDLLVRFRQATGK